VIAKKKGINVTKGANVLKQSKHCSMQYILHVDFYALTDLIVGVLSTGGAPYLIVTFKHSKVAVTKDHLRDHLQDPDL